MSDGCCEISPYLLNYFRSIMSSLCDRVDQFFLTVVLPMLLVIPGLIEGDPGCSNIF